MDGQNPVMMPETKGSRSWIVWVVVAAIVIVAAIYLFGGRTTAPGSEIGTEDTTAAIGEQLESIDIGSLDAELMDLNAELEQL